MCFANMIRQNIGVNNWVVQIVLPPVPVPDTYSGCKLSGTSEENIQMKLILASGCNMNLDCVHVDCCMRLS